ncbi:MAG: response regulator [Candidatus Competibacteraceae bacterium]|nr:response regulator [Candidatus Competibacteraceae bacterium]
MLLVLPSAFYIAAAWILPFYEVMLSFFIFFLPFHHTLVMLWASYVCLYAFLKERSVIGFLVFSGIIALSATNTHAILVAMQVIQDVLYLHFGLIVFILMQAAAIARKNKDAYMLSEKLALDLKSKSEELKKTNQELASQAKQLKRMDRLKDNFLTNTSHELKTPLNGIIGLTQSLRDQGQSHLQQRHYLSLINHSARRLYNLVNDILDFSRIRHQDIKLNLKPLDLSSLVDLILITVKPLVGDKLIELNNHVAPNIPQVFADEDRVQQILFNLIGNAIKFTDHGAVTVTALAEGELIRVLVKDTGIGIPKEEQSHIFEAFSQANRPKADTYGGTGLGLSIAKQLVELHGGTMQVESSEKPGAVFSFTLPVYPKLHQSQDFMPSPFNARFIEPDPNVYLREDINSNIAQPAQNTVTILIVDDESINVQLISDHLSSNHYQIWVARNGLAALELLQTKKPDLVVMDLMMPIMNGFEATRRIRQHYSLTQLPIIILTIRNQSGDLIEGLSAGANDYLLKPFHKEELLARIKAHLNITKTQLIVDKFVPTDFLRQLDKKSILDIRLGDNVEREVSILFSDIRSFSSFAEQATSEQVFSYINFYLNKMGPLVRHHGGFIDQYVGDAIVALFCNSPDDALQSAINMLSFLKTYNEAALFDNNLGPIRIGIGLHFGET